MHRSVSTPAAPTRRSRLAASLIGLGAGALLLAGCASQPDEVQAHYVSTAHYQSFDCDQVEMELERVSARVAEVTGNQQSAADGDAVATGVGLILFWPALFFLAGGDHSDELGRLKGEYEALERVTIEKKCPFAGELAERRQREAEARAAREAEVDPTDPAPQF